MKWMHLPLLLLLLVKLFPFLKAKLPTLSIVAFRNTTLFQPIWRICLNLLTEILCLALAVPRVQFRMAWVKRKSTISLCFGCSNHARVVFSKSRSWSRQWEVFYPTPHSGKCGCLCPHFLTFMQAQLVLQRPHFWLVPKSLPQVCPPRIAAQAHQPCNFSVSWSNPGSLIRPPLLFCTSLFARIQET